MATSSSDGLAPVLSITGVIIFLGLCLGVWAFRYKDRAWSASVIRVTAPLRFAVVLGLLLPLPAYALNTVLGPDYTWLSGLAWIGFSIALLAAWPVFRPKFVVQGETLRARRIFGGWDSFRAQDSVSAILADSTLIPMDLSHIRTTTGRPLLWSEVMMTVPPRLLAAFQYFAHERTIYEGTFIPVQTLPYKPSETMTFESGCHAKWGDAPFDVVVEILMSPMAEHPETLRQKEVGLRALCTQYPPLATPPDSTIVGSCVLEGVAFTVRRHPTQRALVATLVSDARNAPELMSKAVPKVMHTTDKPATEIDTATNVNQATLAAVTWNGKNFRISWRETWHPRIDQAPLPHAPGHLC